MIPHNVNSILDIVVRLILVLVFVIASWALNVFTLYAVGMLLLVTALSGYCPLYHVLGKGKKRAH